MLPGVNVESQQETKARPFFRLKQPSLTGASWQWHVETARRVVQTVLEFTLQNFAVLHTKCTQSRSFPCKITLYNKGFTCARIAKSSTNSQKMHKNCFAKAFNFCQNVYLQRSIFSQEQGNNNISGVRYKLACKLVYSVFCIYSRHKFPNNVKSVKK